MQLSETTMPGPNSTLRKARAAQCPRDAPPQAAVRRQDVEFASGGTTCRAWLYALVTDSARPKPCIVMAHGLGGTRAASLEPYTERFARAGCNVLLFDYRYLGDSEGEPRQLIEMRRQLDDWRAAIAFARTLPGVDAQRIGLWGTSLSGGHVMVIAAEDARIAAISAQCPMLDGLASARLAAKRTGFTTGLRMIAAALADFARGCLGRSPRYVPLVGPSGSFAALASDEAYAACGAIFPEGWRNEVAARILFSLPLYRPVRTTRSIGCPALLIACMRLPRSLTKIRAAGRPFR